ncbi:ergosterol biosynthesis ERG4/ERG24 [Zopfochytrium polystomum]|nr:ergosterol biosynthesis ERG4/ERG24 [Zopfochytrium polystomum]
MAPPPRQRPSASTSTTTTTTSTMGPLSAKNVPHQIGKTWGRARDISLGTIIMSFTIMMTTPLVVIYFWRACDSFQCDIAGPALQLADRVASSSKPITDTLGEWLREFVPTPTASGFQLYYTWLLFQALMYVLVPAKIGYGQTTPAGYTLPYVVNGLRVWFITHVLYFALSLGAGLFPASIIHDNWGGLLIAANSYGYFLTLFSYFKALLFPSHAADRKFSGSIIYDIFMGVEFNPRLGKWFDFKLFHNGRPGIVAWTLINASFAAAQYERIGYITNSMILVNILHAIYVLDFFYNEDWYLRTIDICHDHFGFYLAWGDSVWLPYMYTLQSHYLVRNPVDLSPGYFSAVLGLGLLGYYIFRAVNHQKDVVRSSDGKCNIWGKPARVLRTEFVTSDGKVHRSLLLVSGFWGVSRHFNYVGDLTISLAMCMACGVGHVLPYFYVVYMTILLLHRIRRDDARCRGKYGKYWEEYSRLVPWKLLPYVY